MNATSVVVFLYQPKDQVQDNTKEILKSIIHWGYEIGIAIPILAIPFLHYLDWKKVGKRIQNNAEKDVWRNDMWSWTDSTHGWNQIQPRFESDWMVNVQTESKTFPCLHFKCYHNFLSSFYNWHNTLRIWYKLLFHCCTRTEGGRTAEGWRRKVEKDWYQKIQKKNLYGNG